MTTTSPSKWHTVYRGSEDKCFFCGKDGKSGLARSEYDWRTTDSLSRESGLSKRRTEEVIDYYSKKGIVIQHTKDPEKWGYWERVGTLKADPDPVKKDHDDRSQKQQNLNNGGAKKPPAAGTYPAPGGVGGGPIKTTPGTGAGKQAPTPTKTAPPAPKTGGVGKISTPPPVAQKPVPATTLPAKVPAAPAKKPAAVPVKTCGTKCPCP